MTLHKKKLEISTKDKLIMSF